MPNSKEASANADFESLAQLDKQIKSFNVGPNPYTWFTMEALADTWKNLQSIIKQRDSELAQEEVRQEENDKLRKKSWLSSRSKPEIKVVYQRIHPRRSQ